MNNQQKNRFWLEKLPKNEAEWKKILNPQQYHVLRQKGTEMPFNNEFYATKIAGTYVCKACGNPLFNSQSKFISSSGWPSFDESLPNAVQEVIDNSMSIQRIEIICARCHSHLGHVFNDGPTPTHKRYCMNSICLNLLTKN